jgi:hypothetical protein
MRIYRTVQDAKGFSCLQHSPCLLFHSRAKSSVLFALLGVQNCFEVNVRISTSWMHVYVSFFLCLFPHLCKPQPMEPTFVNLFLTCWHTQQWMSPRTPYDLHSLSLKFSLDSTCFKGREVVVLFAIKLLKFSLFLSLSQSKLHWHQSK